MEVLLQLSKNWGLFSSRIFSLPTALKKEEREFGAKWKLFFMNKKMGVVALPRSNSRMHQHWKTMKQFCLEYSTSSFSTQFKKTILTKTHTKLKNNHSVMSVFFRESWKCPFLVPFFIGYYGYCFIIVQYFTGIRKD